MTEERSIWDEIGPLEKLFKRMKVQGEFFTAFIKTEWVWIDKLDFDCDYVVFLFETISSWRAPNYIWHL